MGTRYFFSVDYDTMRDNTVTIRFRDTMEQERVSIDRLHEIISDRVSLRSLLEGLK